jgi:hypothetical protein
VVVSAEPHAVVGHVADLDLLEADEGRRAEPAVDLGVAIAEADPRERQVAGRARVVGEDLGDEGHALAVLVEWLEISPRWSTCRFRGVAR